MIVIKEEFVGSDKYLRAYTLGRGEAIALWLALKCYASRHPGSEGFIPDEDIERLPGAPRAPRKVLPALVDCGRLLPDGTRSAGLVESATGGWKLHDYLDHSVTPEETELRRQKARLKKQRQREDQRRELDALLAGERYLSTAVDNLGATAPVPGNVPPRVPRGVPPVPPPVPSGVPPSVPPMSLTGPRPPASAPAPALTRAGPRPQPNPPLSNPNQNSGSGSGRARGPTPTPATATVGVDAGTRGHLRVEPQSEHCAYAKEHGINLEEAVRKLNADPRTKTLSTVEGWAVLTRQLEKTAARARLGGAA